MWKRGNGTYRLDLIYKRGCASSDSIITVEHENPVIFLGTDTSLCPRDTLNLNPFVSGPAIKEYDWLLNGLPAGSSSLLSVPSGKGAVIKVYVETAAGCKDSAEMVIGEIDIPVQPFTDTTVCPESSLEVLPASDKALISSFTWSEGDIISSTKEIKGKVKVSLTDALGSEVYADQFEDGGAGLFINLEDLQLQPGMYLLRIVSGDEVMSLVMVKNE